MNLDPYAQLGVATDASEAEIRAAHRKRTKETHPDAGGTDEASQAVQQAYAVLSSPDRRAHYDRTGKTEQESPEVAMMNKAIDYVGKLLGVYVAGDIDPGTDVRAFLLDQCRQERANIVRTMDDTELKLKRTEAFAGRVKRRKRKSDALEEVLLETNDQAILNQAVEIHRCGAMGLIAECVEALAVRDVALGLLERHDYRVDPPKPIPGAWTQVDLRGFGFGSATSRFP